MKKIFANIFLAFKQAGKSVREALNQPLPEPPRGHPSCPYCPTCGKHL